MLHGKASLLILPLEFLLVYILLAAVKRLFSVPDIILPYPSAILSRFITTIGDRTVLGDLGYTVLESLSGFSIAFIITMLLGYLIAKSRLLSAFLMPGLVAANTIPSVALAPFLVMWFGFGLAPKIITSVIVIFFPMLINNTHAIREAGERVEELVRFYRPGRRKTFLKFELPAALPMIASGVKISITLSVIGAVVGEFVSGHRGLGALVSRAKAMFDVELMFVGLLWLVFLGLAYYALASLLTVFATRRRG